MHGVAVLGKDGEDVAFAQLEGQAADIDVGGVAVVGVPASIGWDAFFEFGIVEAGNLADGLHPLFYGGEAVWCGAVWCEKSAVETDLLQVFCPDDFAAQAVKAEDPARSHARVSLASNDMLSSTLCCVSSTSIRYIFQAQGWIDWGSNLNKVEC